MSSLLAFLPRHRVSLAIAGWLAIAGALASLALARLVGALLGQAVHGAITLDATVVVAAVGFGRVGLAWAQGRIANRVASGAATDLRTTLLERATRIDPDVGPTSELSTRITHDTNLLQHFVGGRLPGAIADTLSALALGGYAFSLDPTTLLVAAAPIVVLAPIVLFWTRRAAARLRDARTLYAALVGAVIETLDARLVLHHFRARGERAEHARGRFHGYEDALLVARDTSAVTSSVVQLAALAGVLAAAAALAESVASGAMTDAHALTVCAALLLAARPVGRLVAGIGDAASVSPATQRIIELLTRAAIPEALPAARMRSKDWKEIRVDGLTVQRGERLVLDGVSLQLRRHDRIAIVGENGTGKTTLLLALLDLLPYEGTVTIDGEPGSLSSLAAWVPQDPALLEGTILDNVALGDPTPDRERAARALDDAGATEWLRRHGGLDAHLSTAGRELSRGEKQRLCIARALYLDTPLLLLDEPTASLDAASVEAFARLLKERSGERTVLLVTHEAKVLAQCTAVVALPTA